MSQPFGIQETSEKTVEVNVLNEMAAYLVKRTRAVPTFIAPTQNMEDTLGFDEYIRGLPNGILVCLQFKRPFPLNRPANYVRFLLDTSQLQTLLGNFQRNQVFYVFSPIPFVYDVSGMRRRLLRISLAVDPHNIPNARKTTQKTRTVRMSRTGFDISIADPREYQSVHNVLSLGRLCNAMLSKDAGIRVNEETKEKGIWKERKVLPRKLYLFHLSNI